LLQDLEEKKIISAGQRRNSTMTLSALELKFKRTGAMG
jgi:hypothetical protein